MRSPSTTTRLRRTRRSARLAVMAVAALLLAGCGGDAPVAEAPDNTGTPTTAETTATETATSEPTTTETEATGEAGAGQGEVTLAEIQFMPAELAVEAGTTVTWSNDDSVAHTVTAEDGGFDSGNMDPGATFEFTFEEPGTYAYICEFHVGSGMTGTVTVE